ncbi:MAG: dihydrolipoamide acetyltransferase family protein [Chloroflexi bacterium]|nr:dihydrolipoamide acetyltransferase family protein [Chloroflexota bacterium]
MTLNIELPHVGESVTEAVIGKWLKSPGDAVEKYEPLVEVVTDKVNMDVPSPASGTLTKILVAEGETVAMGSVIAEMETSDTSASADQPSALPPISDPPAANRIGTLVQGANVGPTGGQFLDTSLSSLTVGATGAPSTPSSPPDGLRRHSPVVVRLATQHKVDLSSISGTGLGGRVTKNDVLSAVEAGKSSTETVLEVPSPGVGDTVVKPTSIRRMIADHMVKSMTEIPHAWSAIEVDVTGLVGWRTANRERFERDHGVRLTYLPVALHVVADALNLNPRINSSWVDGNIVLKGEINVGVAVAAPEGLVVPVVRDAANSPIAELARNLDGLIDRARSNSLKLEDVQGGTFTLNNTGALGSVWGGAIINHPQAAILTTEAIVKRPVVITVNDSDTVVVRSMMNICLSFDHRIVDGADASAFLQSVRSGLQSIRAESELT